jgi:LysM repeat protein
MLSIGQSLRIPSVSKPLVANKAEEVKKTDRTEMAGSVYYTMKTGDSPWKVAKQNNMNLDDLLRLNNLDEEKARSLKVGDKIRIK